MDRSVLLEPRRRGHGSVLLERSKEARSWMDGSILLELDVSWTVDSCHDLGVCTSARTLRAEVCWSVVFQLSFSS